MSMVSGTNEHTHIRLWMPGRRGGNFTAESWIFDLMSAMRDIFSISIIDRAMCAVIYIYIFVISLQWIVNKMSRYQSNQFVAVFFFFCMISILFFLIWLMMISVFFSLFFFCSLFLLNSLHFIKSIVLTK